MNKIDNKYVGSAQKSADEAENKLEDLSLEQLDGVSGGCDGCCGGGGGGGE
jgi:hypothetical protein